MKRLFAALLMMCLCAVPAGAHRLDEYLQATILSLDSGEVRGSMRLVPGVAVASSVIADIDQDGDGVLSEAEQQAYAQRVMDDLVLAEDDKRLVPHLLSVTFPSIDEMKLGTGEIQINFSASLPSNGGIHQLTFENHHMAAISVFLVNSLVPQNTGIQIVGQSRNQNQSFYAVSFAQTGRAETSQSFSWSGFAGAFHLGLRHIAEGTDHLLFLLTLLLPAPLIARAGKWRDRASVRRSLLQILSIVTAFTLGHSVTLALAGFGLVRVPSRPVEILIAVSILVSAVHALRPLLPGREAAIAAFFGLIHGLAFASALNELGVTGWYRLISIFGFNLGIEAMQLAVVAMTLPALLLLSRTSFYGIFRVGGGLVAALASVVWIIERSFDRLNLIGNLIERAAQHGLAMAAVLFAVSVCAWLFDRERLPLRKGTASEPVSETSGSAQSPLSSL